MRALVQSKPRLEDAAHALALGIGANSAICGVVHSVLLRPLPFPAPERNVTLISTHAGHGIRDGGVMAFTVSRRAPEIGVRIAPGATRRVIAAISRPSREEGLDGRRTFSFNRVISFNSRQARPGAEVPSYTVEPGARVLWCLRRRTSDIRCVLYANTTPVEVQVMQDRDIVLIERFAEEWLALNWARVYGDRLKSRGWEDTPS